jgi:hypothetical protein
MSSHVSELDDLFRRERLLVLEARHRQTVGKRWFFAGVVGLLMLIAWLSGGLLVSLRLGAVLGVAVLLGNLAAWWLIRSGRYHPAQFWGMMVLDDLVLVGLIIVLGVHGYLVVPFLFFGIIGYTIGMPRAATVSFWAVGGGG